MMNDIGHQGSSKPREQMVPPEGKIKTDVANCYGQFLKFKKQELKEKDPNAKINRKKTEEEWRALDQNRKDFFVKRWRQEKEKMGGNYRKRELKLVKKITDQKQKKQKNVKKTVDAENPTLKFLEKLESVDISIEKLSKENEVTRDNISNLKVDNAVFKFKLKSKSDELETLKDKYEQLLTQHNMCKL